jgi:hypothetical protein
MSVKPPERSPGAKSADVVIDPVGPLQELVAIAEEAPVMIQVVHVDLEAAFDFVKKAGDTAYLSSARPGTTP